MNEYQKLNNTLADLESKSIQEGEASNLATGTYRIPNDGSVLPLAVDDIAQSAFDRASNLVQSWGPKILQRKIDGIVGNINWSSNNKKLDNVLDSYDLVDLATRLAADLVVKGSAGLALSADEVAGARVYRLSGFVHALRNPENPDEVTGILQAYYGSDFRQTIKLFKQNQTALWRGRKNIADFVKYEPDRVLDSEVRQVAFYAASTTDDAGIAIGEIELLAPKLKNLISIEARILRVSEAASFPRLVIKGQVKESGFGRHSHNVSSVIQMETGGDVSYLESTQGTKQLLEEKADLISNLNEIATLPAGFVSSDTPSGDALQEVNQAFNKSLERYAGIISRLLTQAFKELFYALGMDAEDLSITLTPNTIVDKAGEIASLLTLIEKKLLPPSYIARRLQNLLVDMTDEEAAAIAEMLTNRTGVISTQELLGAFTG